MTPAPASDLIVAAARRWIGTPYRHQARTRGAGCDCLGLVLGVWEELIGPLPGPVPAYTADWSEAGREERLWQAARAHMTETANPAPGQVLLFRMRRGAVAKHLGLATETGPAPAFIHAYSGRGVVESPLTGPWARRIVARFTLPGPAVFATPRTT